MTSSGVVVVPLAVVGQTTPDVGRGTVAQGGVGNHRACVCYTVRTGRRGRTGTVHAQTMRDYLSGTTVEARPFALWMPARVLLCLVSSRLAPSSSPCPPCRERALLSPTSLILSFLCYCARAHCVVPLSSVCPRARSCSLYISPLFAAYHARFFFSFLVLASEISPA